jgi:D-alanyl-lipoteichoic acid acyltransferase DltB (MBOAT superfamily)
VLFNSYAFIAGFLPLVLAAAWLVARLVGRRAVVPVLLLGSLFFYAWWYPPALALLVASITVNYGLGRAIRGAARAGRRRRARLLVGGGVAANLATIGWFKYANFLAGNLSALTGGDPFVHDVALPLGISFFTFQQIAYLVDQLEGRAGDDAPLDYALFISFFPQLIAGPIVRHREFLPQLDGDRSFRFTGGDLALGLTIFAIGLVKKTVIADGIAVNVSPAFAAAEQGAPLTLLEAWCAALGYTLQIYFDFSGYSDMAIGLGRLFGLKLPTNFNSPYKARSIIEFWRRWHITLSRFLREYLYIPLGGNRRGRARRWGNLLITMLLGGLWHGAGWTFILWGGLHGLMLCLNHAWRYLRRGRPGRLERGLLAALTFLAIVVTWVFFRADSLDGAGQVLAGMAGLNGLVLPDAWSGRYGPVMPALAAWGVPFADLEHFHGFRQLAALAGGFALCWLAPNSGQIARRLAAPRAWPMPLRHPMGQAVAGTAFGGLACYALVRLYVGGYNEFLYFQF